MNENHDHVKSWSTFTIKGIDEESRTITGIASTPGTDRDGDIVDPTGAKYKLPLPLLAQHQHDSPVGEVIEAKTTSKGIEITARLPKDTGLDYVDRAWKQLKAKLLRGLSIGFRGLVVEPIKTGLHFKEWEWYELSLVTVPANADCSITSVKKFDESPDQDQLIQREMEIHDARKRCAAALAKLNVHLKS